MKNLLTTLCFFLFATIANACDCGCEQGQPCTCRTTTTVRTYSSVGTVIVQAPVFTAPDGTQFTRKYKSRTHQHRSGKLTERTKSK